MMIRRTLLMCSLLPACNAGEDALPPPPEVLASSKYIDYGTWADSTVICMDDKLAEWDRFIEETADFLQVARPTGRIQYIWAPEGAGPESAWGCSDKLGGCYHYLDEQDRGVIYTRQLEYLHELVHAVDVPVFSPKHVVLSEGIAEYIGSNQTTEEVLEDFPARFKDVVSDWNADESRYGIAMHFVGSIILRDGIGKYNELRRRVPPMADVAEFAAVYAEVYGRELDSDLAEMAASPVQGRQPVIPGCDAGPPALPWSSPDSIETTLTGECGDGWFYGGGFADGKPGFMTLFVIQIEKEGGYEMTVRDPTATGEAPLATLNACPGVVGSTGVASSQGQTSFGLLAPGRHVLRVFYPPMPEAKQDLTLTLTWVSPPPP